MKFAKKSAAKAGQSMRYGMIATPDGEFIVSFGYGREEFTRALKMAMGKYPKLARFSKGEEQIVQKAKKEPMNVKAQIKAARIYSEILQPEKAIALMDGFLKNDVSPKDEAIARYWKGHFLTMEIENPHSKLAGELLSSTKNLPMDLQDDAELDRISLDVELISAPGFFTGWQYKKGTDLKKTIAALESWLKKDPRSNRRGQMYFLLGLAKHQAGEKQEAKSIWAKHVKELPDDRFAMLSRIHHPGYQFSPFGGPSGNGNTFKIKLGGNSKGGSTIIRGIFQGAKRGKNGNIQLSSEQKKKLLEMIRQQREQQKKKKKSGK